MKPVGAPPSVVWKASVGDLRALHLDRAADVEADAVDDLCLRHPAALQNLRRADHHAERGPGFAANVHNIAGVIPVQVGDQHHIGLGDGVPGGHGRGAAHEKRIHQHIAGGVRQLKIGVAVPRYGYAHASSSRCGDIPRSSRVLARRSAGFIRTSRRGANRSGIARTPATHLPTNAYKLSKQKRVVHFSPAPAR